MNNFKSHLIYKFHDYTLKNKIELFRLPAHSTYFSQSLDVGCFQPFKHYHSEAVDESV